MRRRAKTDGNHARIVEALRTAGATVQSLAEVGCGAPDLAVGYRRQTFLLEVKDGTLPPARRRLTSDQALWIDRWRGLPVAIVTSVDEALVAIGAISRRGPVAPYRVGVE